SYSTSFMKHCEKYVKSLDRTYGIGPNTNFLEIASNDGCLLKYVKPYGAKILGVEPATNIAEIANVAGVPTLNSFFGEEAVEEILKGFGHCDFIVGNNVLAHVADINGFVKAVKSCLGTEGIAVFEFPYLLNLIHNVEFDTIYHEHLFYYSIHSLNNLFERHGLEIFDVQAQSIHGGSIRIFVQHTNYRPVNSIVSYYELIERMYDLDNELGYKNFAGMVTTFKNKFRSLLVELNKMNLTVAAYGAPAKSTTLLNYCEIGPDLIKFTVDISPHKQGKYLPGSHIPIYARDMLLLGLPNYTVVLPWNFIDEIKEQQQTYLDLGGKFINPANILKIGEIAI
ncbi:MAG TPA: class I SAM-dependent methyltransferase, partial [Aquella sp.]|nr:class I SAM-dependent methyltransferase [Aquella sp.]